MARRLWVLVMVMMFSLSSVASASHQDLSSRSYGVNIYNQPWSGSATIKGVKATIGIPTGFGYGSHTCSSSTSNSVFVQGGVWSSYDNLAIGSYVELAARRGRQVDGSPICRDDWYMRVVNSADSYNMEYSCAGLKALYPQWITCPTWSPGNSYTLKVHRITSAYYRLYVGTTLVADVYTPDADNPGYRANAGFETNFDCGQFTGTGTVSGHAYTTTADGSSWTAVPSPFIYDSDYDETANGAQAHWDGWYITNPTSIGVTDN